MDCRTARDILDVVRPGTVERADTDVSAAFAHVDDCDDCMLTVRSRQALDRRIGRALRDVPVPAGLRDRLRAALAEASVDAAAAGVDRTADEPTTRVRSIAESARPVLRRRWMRVAAITAMVMLLAAGVWFLSRETGPDATLARLYAEVPLDPAEAEPFDGNFEPVLPGGGWTSHLAIARLPQGSDLGLGGEHVVALYRFRFRGRDGRIVDGLLAVAPAGTIDAGRSLPSSFAAADVDYPGRRLPGGQQLGARAWAAGSFVYVCIVPADRLDELGHLLDLPIG